MTRCAKHYMTLLTRLMQVEVGRPGGFQLRFVNS